MYERVDEIPQELLNIRDEFLNRYGGKNLDGLDIYGLNEYFAYADLDVKPYVVITPSDLETVNEIDKKTGAVLNGIFEVKGAEGVFSPELGISIILRSPDLEARNGTVYTEGLIVHEAAHSTAGIVSYLRESGTSSYFNLRSGFALPYLDRSSGFLFEEGWADWHRGNYISQQFFEVNIFGRTPKMPSWFMEPEAIVTIEGDGSPLPLPFKYVRMAEDGRLTHFTSSVAAYAIELLISENPNIATAMHAGRTKVDGLKDLAKEVDSLQPGAYPALRHLNYRYEDFAKGLRMVMYELVASPLVARCF